MASLEIPSVDISSVRKYSLAELDDIDFSSSDDSAVVVEKIKTVITLEKDYKEMWTEDHEEILWRFVIDTEIEIIVCYIAGGALFVECSLPKECVSEFFYFIKASKKKLYAEDYDENIMYGTAKAPFFESLYELLSNMYSPMFVESADWPKSIKSEYVQLSKFLSELFDLRNKLLGELILYVPAAAIKHDVEYIVENKDLFNEVERAVMKWVWILIGILMKRGSTESQGRVGPLQELKFWENKCSVLQKACCQLDRDDVNKCIEILKHGKSGCLKKIQSLHLQISSEQEVAISNVKFLKILKATCEVLETSSLTDIPNHASHLLDLIRIIYNNSPYFRNNSEIASFVSKANVFIIKAISRHILLSEIFSEWDFEHQEKLLNIISCSKIWIEAFEFSEKVHKTHAPFVWSVESVSALVNLFIHRCEELIEVCAYKDEFQCTIEAENYPQNHKCFEVAAQLKDIENKFCDLLKTLAEHKECALEIQTAVWYNYFKIFKTGTYKLEVEVKRLMSSSLQNVTIIEDGIEILLMFKKFFTKEVVKGELQRCLKSIYEIFLSEANFVKKRLIDIKKLEESHLPKYGGTAFGVSILLKRLLQQYKVLEENKHMWPSEFHLNIEGQYIQVLEAANELKSTLLLEWTKNLPKDPFAWLKESVVIKNEASFLLQINLKSNVLNLFEELHYWNKSGIEIPNHLSKLHEKSDFLMRRIYLIRDCVNKYNRLIKPLTLEHGGMFAEIAQSLHENVLPIFIELNWSSPQGSFKALPKLFSDKIKPFTDSLSQYENCKSKIFNMVTEIGTKKLFSTNFPNPVDFEMFLQKQSEHRTKTLQEINKMCQDIHSEMKKASFSVKKRKYEDENFLKRLFQEVSAQVCNSLVSCYISSVKAAHTFFGLNRKKKTRVFLKIYLTIVNQEFSYKPDYKEIWVKIENFLSQLQTELMDTIASSLGGIETKNNFTLAIESSKSIKELKKDMHNGICKLNEAQKEYLLEFEEFEDLWKCDCKKLAETYSNVKLDIQEIQKEISRFCEFAHKINLAGRYKLIEFCIIDCNPFKDNCLELFAQWRSQLGDILVKTFHYNLETINDLLSITSTKFCSFPKTLKELKTAIRLLVQVKSYIPNIDSTLSAAKTCYQFLKEYRLYDFDQTLLWIGKLNEDWANLKAQFEDYRGNLEKAQAIHLRKFLNFYYELKNQTLILEEKFNNSGVFEFHPEGYGVFLTALDFFSNFLTSFHEKESWILRDADFFNVSLEPFKALATVQRELPSLQRAWSVVAEAQKFVHNVDNVHILDLNIEEQLEKAEILKKNILAHKRKEKGDCLKIFDGMLQYVKDLKCYYGIIKEFQEPTLHEKHFAEFKKILKLADHAEFNTVTFSHLRKLGLDDLEQIKEVAKRARKESELEESLKAIETVWKTKEFKTCKYKNSYKFEAIKEIAFAAESDRMTLGQMKASAFGSLFTYRIEILEDNLEKILSVVEQIEQFQIKFSHLQNIFAENSGQDELAGEVSEFENLSKEWGKMITDMIGKGSILEISNQPAILSILDAMIQKNVVVQKSLESFLETKRAVFPRFYFLSNEDLLYIMGHGTPKGILPHLRKCFGGLTKLEIMEKREEKMREAKIIMYAKGMYSDFEEYVEFANPILLDGPVEKWMTKVEEMMRFSLLSSLPKSLHSCCNMLGKDFNFTEAKWISNWPSQICILSILISWTTEVTHTINEVQEMAVIGPLKSLRKKWREILNQFTKRFQSDHQILIQMKAMMILLTLVHACDIIDSLIKYMCNDPSAFEWLVNLRYYYNETTKDCFIHQTSARLKYRYEFLGCGERLVLTPLTDRCFLSMTMALHLHQSILFQGHDGVGKTETLKELGKCIGNFVVVLSCSETLTSSALMRNVSAISQIGAWCLLEHFDQIHSEIVNVISQQINAIFQAFRSNNDKFSFGGSKIPIKEGFELFLSCSSAYPVTKYELPSSLTDIFRPLSMSAPNIQMIIQVHLFAYGFSQYKTLAHDLQQIFLLAQEQLSKYQQYDFGLRTVMAFLKLVKMNKDLLPEESDNEIVLQSLMLITETKLSANDIPHFKSILQLVLGTEKRNEPVSNKLEKSVEVILKENGLQPLPFLMQKVVQFHEMKQLFHALILVGDTANGKTTTWKTLKEVYSHPEPETNFPSIETYTFHPKAFSHEKLFGHFDSKGIWNNGIFVDVLLDASHNVKRDEKWIILDGPMHMDWLVNLHQLLDCNKIFTVSDGETVFLPEKVFLVFETGNLTHSSPYTVGHCGVIYFATDTISWKSCLDSWFQIWKKPFMTEKLKSLFTEYLSKILNFAAKSLKGCKILPTSEINLITAFCKILDAVIEKFEEEVDFDKTKLLNIFWFSAIWSVGSSIDKKGREIFSNYVRSFDESLYVLDNVFDYFLDEHLQWTVISKPSTQQGENGNFMFTDGMLGNQNLIPILLRKPNSLLIVGEADSGKTSFIKCIHKSMKADSKFLTVSPQATSLVLQKFIENELDQVGSVFRPRKRRLLIFLDDLNSASCDQYGCMSLLELIRMTIESNIWYSDLNRKFNSIEDVHFTASASPHGRPGNWIDERLLNRFFVIRHFPPEDIELEHFFASVLKSTFRHSLELQSLSHKLSACTMNVYKAVLNEFLPTPSRLHYQFSLRDVRKVFNSLLFAAPELINKSFLIRFWCHECSREFSDKLINVSEKERFREIMDEIVKSCFSDDISEVSKIHDTWFVKYLKEDKTIIEVEDIRILEKKFQESVDVLNIHGFESPIPRNELPNLPDDHSLLNMVFFKNFVDHVHRIVRGLAEPFGHMCLIGSSGTGRRTLSRISAVLLKYLRFEITSCIKYGEEEFKKDLQMLLHETGVNQKKVLFLLSEEQIADDCFLEYLSSILSMENLTHLYEREQELQKDNCNSNEDFTKIPEMFVESIRQNFHLIISLNYSGVLYKSLFLKYPALFKSMAIECFDEWPQDALETVSDYYLQKMEHDDPLRENINTGKKLLAEMHEDVKASKVPFQTSVTIINFTNNFVKVLNEKRKKVEAKMQRLSFGLIKINEAEDAVSKIAAETAEAREKLFVAERECDEALVDLQRKKSVVALKKEIIQEKKIEIEKKEKVCQKIELAAQEDLTAALPALEEAKKALEALNKKDIGEIKSYAKPPPLVEIVLEAVMILRHSEPSWAEAKRQLGNASFLKELLEYDTDNIPDSDLKKVLKYIRRPEFQPHIVGKVSNAAKSLCMWVRAMYVYGMIYKKVKPKKERLRLAIEEREKLRKALADLWRELLELEEEILKLEKEHELLLLKKEEYARNAKLLALKLERAQNIMNSLKSEQLKWQKKISILEEKQKFIFGDSFLASGFLTYLGPLGPVLRQNTFLVWKKRVMDYKFLCSPDFDPVNFFLEEETSDAWNMHELPPDQYSYENATIFGQSYYCPFIIDPQEQVFKWLKNIGANQNIRLIDSQDPEWSSLLEAAILDGCPGFLYNMKPDLFPALLPLLQLIHRPLFIKLNGKRLQVKPTFRFYMSTNLEKLNLPTGILSKINVVNFAIKEKGLEDQLLSLIVHNERSDLEVTKRKLVKSIAEGKKQLYDIEDTVLSLLSKAHGSLLDDEQLVEVLNKSKSSSIQIEQLLTSNEKTQNVIDEAREKYRTCAKDAATLYFVMADLIHIDSMYVFSLDAYFELFMNSIKISPPDQDLEQRIQKLKEFHCYAVYKFACRTVREKHALILAFYMGVKILQGKGKLSKEEFELFIKIGHMHEKHASLEIPNPCSQWLPGSCWNNIIQLERMPKFLGITASFEDMGKAWHEWYITAEPEKTVLPGNWQNVCTEFQRLIIVRSLRMDRITSCIHTFIKNSMGERFLAYPHTSFPDIVKDSVAQKPLVALTVSGDIDPAIVIYELAKQFGMQNKYESMALNQGEEYKAAELIIDSAKMGYWIFIHNCKSVPSFMLALEKTINKLNIIKVHPEFRLWLEAHPNSQFPTSILQKSVVITLESPQGIKDNMLKLYDFVQNTEDYQTCENQSKYKSVLFSLCFFHSLLLERKKFCTLGWNAEYNFSFADFKISENILRFYIDKYKEVPWEALKTLIADVIYGGHISDNLDKRLLITYFDQLFGEETCANIQLPLCSLEEYYIPEEGSLESHVNFIQNLPSIDAPEVFGQHSSAEIADRMNMTEQLLDHLLKMYGEISTSLDDHINNQVFSIVQNLQQQIPPHIDEKISFEDNQELYNYILIQEVKKYNVLVKVVGETLNNLHDVLIGKLIMTEKSGQIYQEIKNLQVPQEWHFAYPSMKPLGSWIKDLKARIQQLSSWIKNEAPPVKFWLPGFIAPKSLLTAAMQSYAKANDVAYKELVWEYHVSTLDETHIRTPPEEGIYAQGLFLEGGGWDKRNSLLVDPEPLQLVTVMPVIHFKPVLESSLRGLYTCPCYYLPKRRDESRSSTFLFNIELKTKKNKEYWIKRGTALLMSTKD